MNIHLVNVEEFYSLLFGASIDELERMVNRDAEDILQHLRRDYQVELPQETFSIRPILEHYYKNCERDVFPTGHKLREDIVRKCSLPINLHFQLGMRIERYEDIGWYEECFLEVIALVTIKIDDERTEKGSDKDVFVVRFCERPSRDSFAILIKRTPATGLVEHATKESRSKLATVLEQRQSLFELKQSERFRGA